MNILKTTIATAAVITCCLGYEMPAKAELSAREESIFEKAYEYGYAYGVLGESCTMFLTGHVSAKELRLSAEWVKKSENLLPLFKTRIAENFQNMADDKKRTQPCNPIIQRVLNPTRQRQMESIQRADNWY